MSHSFMFDPWGGRVPLASSIIIKWPGELLGSPGHWAAALGRLMPQRNICQSGACGSWAAFPSSINQTKLMNLPLRLVLMPVQAWEHTGDGCMHACMLGKQCTLTVSHYCAITSVYLWHSGYPNKDFHMPVTDVFPVWTLFKNTALSQCGKTSLLEEQRVLTLILDTGTCVCVCLSPEKSGGV